MLFQERLNELMSALCASNAQIAHYAGFDRTNISRLRSGVRVPRRGGPTAEKLVSGLYLFADDRNELGKLCAVIGTDPDAPASEMKAAVDQWLFGGQAPEPTGARSRRKAAEFHSFGERLDRVMTLTELSNVRLSRLVNVDASLISRFRTGVRTPRSNPELSERICRTLLGRVQEAGRLPDLSRMMKLPLQELDEDSFRNWLCDYGKQDIPDASAVERLLAGFDFLPSEPEPPAAGALPEPAAEDRTLYFGRAGLQSAVVRFLGDAIRTGAEELCLYSDQNMDWMVKDRAYLSRWFGLMRDCVHNGIRIRIIHNIDRDLEEMISAITSWLPLYLSGQIEPYTCRRRNDGRFSHTLFLCPGTACVEAFHVIGTEDQSLYHYHTEERALEVCKRGFETLMENSRPLLRLQKTEELHRDGGGLAVMQSTLSLATMPESLVREFHSEKLYREWVRQRALYETCLHTSFVYECIPTATEAQLLEGAVPVESGAGDLSLTYTPEQYSAHIQSIINLSGQYPNYRFYALPEAPFRNMKLTVGTDFVSVRRTQAPFFSFQLTHPLMHSAFRAYIHGLMERYKVDRNTLRKDLGRYLSIIPQDQKQEKTAKKEL